MRTLAGVRSVRWLMGLIELAGYIAVAAMFWLRANWLIALVIVGVMVWIPYRLFYDRRHRRSSGSMKPRGSFISDRT
ncbi:MAG: hypothetical protein IT446_15925 [Phycisphaerales bacterium]|nr:hypothetical protein [Phycisphaerales bacterium]